MTPLLEAVYDQLKGDASIIAIVGSKVYFGRARDNVDLPYLVFSRQGSFPPVVYTSRTLQVEHIIIRFETWSIESDQAMTGVEAVEKLFRGTWPVLASGTVMQVTKQGDTLEIDPTPTSDGDDVRRGIVDMDFMIQRDPTA